MLTRNNTHANVMSARSHASPFGINAPPIACRPWIHTANLIPFFFSFPPFARITLFFPFFKKGCDGLVRMKKASTRTSFLSRLQQQAIRTMRHTGGSTRLEQSYILGWREQPSPFASAQSCVLRGPKGDATASTTTLIGTAATCAVPRTFAPILYMHTYAWPWLTVAFPCTTICIGRVVKTRLRATLCAKNEKVIYFLHF